MRFLVPALAICALGVSACSSSSNSSNPSTDTNYTVSGKLSSLSASSKVVKNGVSSLASKTITHVMAMSPQTSSPERYIGEVGADGSFNLGIRTHAPYIFVFIDSSKVGEDMIVGIFNPGSAGLDTLLPLIDGGSTSLGTVSVDGTSQEATMSTTFADFLSALGIDSTTAATVGAVDDLSLRAANPDIDSNGVIDALEGKSMWLDFHVRSMMNCSSGCSGGRMSYDAFNGSYLTDAAGFALEPAGTSIYAIHDTSIDSTPMGNYITGGSTTLNGGAGWAATSMPGGNANINAHSSFSYTTFGEYRQWGPDFNLGTSGIELPGYDEPVKLVWTLAGSKSMTYTHVRTRAKSGLFALVPDFKINVDSNDLITSIDYRWMKWDGSAWEQATAQEVQLLVADETAAIVFSTVKTASVEEGLRVMLPTNTASGTIAWNATSVERTSGVTANVTTMKLDDFCGGGSSYDDKLGLRIFAYAFNPTTSSGKTVCP